MQIRTRIKTEEPTNKFESELEKDLLSYARDLSQILNKGIDFNDNFNCQIKTYTTNGTANTEDAVSHTLKRIPTGYLIIGRDKAGIVYNSGTTWTTTDIYLKCSVTSMAVTIIIF